MTTRFFPVSVRIRGDVGITDQQAIGEINEILGSPARDARGGTGGTVRSDRYQVQPLDPAQFVMEIGAAQRALGIDAKAYGMPKVTITRTGYDPNNPIDDPMLEGVTPSAKQPEWEPPGGLKRPPRITPRNGRKRK